MHRRKGSLKPLSSELQKPAQTTESHNLNVITNIDTDQIYQEILSDEHDTTKNGNRTKESENEDDQPQNEIDLQLEANIAYASVAANCSTTGNSVPEDNEEDTEKLYI